MWGFQFQPHGNDATLDLYRGEPGRGGLFYSGLTIRFDNALTPGKLLDAAGRTEPMDIFGKQSRWCGFAGTHAEDGAVYGGNDHRSPFQPTPSDDMVGAESGELRHSPPIAGLL